MEKKSQLILQLGVDGISYLLQKTTYILMKNGSTMDFG